MKYDLKKLKKAAIEACDLAQMEKSLFENEAINWGSLACFSAEYCEDDDGDIFYRIWMSEAAPESSKFHQYIRNVLDKKGCKKIRVATEW